MSPPLNDNPANLSAEQKIYGIVLRLVEHENYFI